MSNETAARLIFDYVRDQDADRVSVLDVSRDHFHIGLADVRNAVPTLADLGVKLTPGHYLTLDDARE